MAQDRAATEETDVGQPFDRRPTVPPGHLLELPDALRRVQGDRDVEVLGGGSGIAQQRLAARVDLCRREETLHPPVRAAAQPFDEARRGFESGPAVVGVQS